METQGSYPYAETVGDVIDNRPVLIFKTEDFLPDILAQLRSSDRKVGAVVDAHDRLVGMVTENNIMRRLLPRFRKRPSDINNLHKHKTVSGLIAWDVMISRPDSLHVDDRIEDAVDVMTYLSHTYMPVTDGQAHVIGIAGFEELRGALEKKYGALKSIDDPISLYMIQQKLHDLGLGVQTYQPV
jgi:CBS-domain-containing membrane protein